MSALNLPYTVGAVQWKRPGSWNIWCSANAVLFLFTFLENKVISCNNQQKAELVAIIKNQQKCLSHGLRLPTSAQVDSLVFPAAEKKAVRILCFLQCDRFISATQTNGSSSQRRGFFSFFLKKKGLTAKWMPAWRGQRRLLISTDSSSSLATMEAFSSSSSPHYLWSLLLLNEEEKANLLCLSAVLQRQKKH